jgi:sugar phosphate isomerase/epimerase
LSLPNAFYAMDTYTKRPYPKNDIPPAEQLDMLREIGYDGIAWTEEPPEQVKAVVAAADARGLKMSAIYFGATVTPEGNLSYSPQLEPVMDVLRGHDTLIWLHLGGKGPQVSGLKADSPVIQRLRELAGKADHDGLRIAIYPHVGDWTERVQDAVQVARLVDARNFGVTFNLCHCLAMGDEARIPALLVEAAPFLFTVTINGADAGVKGANWKQLIQTLDQGTYDTTIVLRTLRQLRFQGPIGVQGYGIGGDRRDNLERSMRAYRRLSAAAQKPKSD